MSVRYCYSRFILLHDALFTCPPTCTFFCTLTHSCTHTYSRLYLATHLIAHQVIHALLFQNFYHKYHDSFHLANIYIYFRIARKDCTSLLPLYCSPHTVSYLSTEINPFLLHLFLPSAVRYPTVIRPFSVLQSDNGPLIGRMR